MTWEATAAVGEIIGAAAMLITLVYISIQLRDARMAQQYEAIRANRQERRDFFTQTRDSQIPDIIAKIETDIEISRADEIRLQNHHSAHWGHLYSEWVQNRIGWHSDYVTPVDAKIQLAFSQPGFIEWFENFASAAYPGEFVKETGRLLEKYREE